MKRILVTGCAGFIGSHFTEKLLAEGYNVTGIDNFDPFYSKEIKQKNIAKALLDPGFSFYELDICNYDDLLGIEERFDAIVHLAAKVGILPSVETPREYCTVNINGTQNILEMMRTKKIRNLVFASSSSVYGNSKSIPFKESDISFPVSPYAFTKKSGELMNHVYHELFDISVMNLRFFTVYGERQRPDLAIHKFTRSIFENRPIILYGDGSMSRDYTHISDTISGIYNALQYLEDHSTPVYEIINLGKNKPIRLIDLATSIYEEIGVAPRISFEESKPGDVELTYADITKAMKLLNYHPRTEFKSGLSSFIHWFKLNTPGIGF